MVTFLVIKRISVFNFLEVEVKEDFLFYNCSFFYSRNDFIHAVFVILIRKKKIDIKNYIGYVGGCVMRL